MEPDTVPRSDVITVHEDRRIPHILYGGFLAVVVVGAWAILRFVDMPADVADQNRIALIVLAALASTALIAAWVYAVRYPARLEVSRDRIVWKRRGRAKQKVLERTNGDLAFETRTRSNSVWLVLTIPDSDQEDMPTGNIDTPKIRQACEALGWRFVE